MELPDQIRGCSLCLLKQKFIVTNANLSYYASLVVISHELGHMQLHISKNYSRKPKHKYFNTNREYEANIFALNLLAYSTNINIDSIHKYLKDNKAYPNKAHKALRDIFGQGL